MNNKTNNLEINEMGLGTCINLQGVPVLLPPKSTTTEENSQEPNHLKVQCITRKRPYFVMIPYYKSFDEKDTRAFVAAAEFKKKRLEKQYPDAFIDVKKVTYKADFIKVWNEINAFLTGPMIQYELREVHFFGHSSYYELNFYGEGNEIKDTDVDQLPILPWSKTVGASALVLHSCRSSRFEEQKEGRDKRMRKCIANDFSIAQSVRVIGQVVYATNNTGDTVEEWKYRNTSSENERLVDVEKVDNIVLWGYCAGGSVKAAYWSLWPSSEYQNLKDMQIWPCRGFTSGSEHPRIVQKEVFNEFDLTYI